MDQTNKTALFAIAKRAERLFFDLEIPRDMVSIIMDLDAANTQYPLRWAAFLHADDSNFTHDILGIYRHLNRETGELEDCFVPRYAA